MTDQANQHAANLYRLAFLLTGDREASVTATIEALDPRTTRPRGCEERS